MFTEIDDDSMEARLPDIIRRAEAGEAGEAFTITHRGKAIADLIPRHAKSRLKAQTAINNLLKMKKPRVSDNDFNAMRHYRKS